MTITITTGSRQLTWTALLLDPVRRLLPVPRRLPPPDSLAFYAILAAVGVAEVVEWPAVLLTAAAQALVDTRLDSLQSSAPGSPTAR